MSIQREKDNVTLPKPEQRVCRDCGTLFITRIPDTGSKWTQLCGYCLLQHV